MKTVANMNNFLNTFSIVGFDPKTGELGVAVASKFLAAAAVVAYAKAGVGAVATQSLANTNYAYKGLELMAAGVSPDEVVEQVTKDDKERDLRQVGFVDATGRSATFTGEKCFEWAGGIAGPDFAVQGNILAGERVVKEMAEVFQNTEGELAYRLLQALQAGDKAGGDSRGKQSAGLLVVKEGGGYGGFDDRYIDLRVDDHKEPVQELIRIFHLHQLYFKRTEPQDILKIEGELKERLRNNFTKLGHLKTSESDFDQTLNDQAFEEALSAFHSIENFEERMQEQGYIDRKVVEYLDHLVKEGSQ